MSLIKSAAYEQTDALDASAAGAAADLIIANQSGNDKKMTLTKLATFMRGATGVGASDITLADGVDIIINATTGTTIGTASGQKIGFYGVTPVNKGDALTSADAVTIDATYNATEQTTMSNMRVRINEIESRLQDVGIIN